MAHHKRKRPRARRAGCKHCKPWKLNSAAAEKYIKGKHERDRQDAHEQLREL